MPPALFDCSIIVVSHGRCFFVVRGAAEQGPKQSRVPASEPSIQRLCRLKEQEAQGSQQRERASVRQP
jgi:hypothetical protein